MKLFYVVLCMVVLFLGGCSQGLPNSEQTLDTQILAVPGFDRVKALAANSNSLVLAGERAETTSSLSFETNGFTSKYTVSPSNLNFAWDRKFGTLSTPTAPATDRAYDITVDASGNSYVLTQENSENWFMRKYAPLGQLEWKKSERGIAVTSDGTNIYILTTIEFPNDAGFYDFKYVVKTYSSSGVVLKTVQSNLIPGLPPTTDGFFYRILGLDIDGSGNAYILYTEGQDRFAARAYTSNLGMLKINADNKQIWNRTLVPEIIETNFPFRTIFISGSFKVDSSGNIYLASNAAKYDYVCDDFPELQQPCGVLNKGYFLHKFDPNGTELWKKQIDTQKTGKDFVKEGDGNCCRTTSGTFTPTIILDTDNTIYISGETAASFNGYANKGGTDIFVVRTDSNGNRRWVTQFGDAGVDAANDLAISSGLYVAGSFGSVSNLYGEDSLLARISRSDGRVVNLLGR
jgi:hypothetical protein